MIMEKSIIQKYNVPGPRYTSYPTVPYWETEDFSLSQWKASLKKSFAESNNAEGLSIYVHLPFCERLCTFCGCHKRITLRHEVEEPYITAVLKEWQLYVAELPEKPRIKELHLGGGTPTFFSTKNLQQLIDGIFLLADKANDYEFSFEGHPNNTTKEHLQTLYNLGFRRVSFGVQDYSPKVQAAINRIQPFENVKNVTEWAKEIGFTSVSHDLIFGLPFQTLEDILFSIEKTKQLAPDRISFYSYAHVPWIKGNGQRGFKDEDVPKDEVKRKLYEEGKRIFQKNGYEEIGMDHFALKTDSLYHSFKNNNLHRNFMGYSSGKTQLMIGLGVSAISDSWYGFAQNEKSLERYYELLNENILPVVKGHILNAEDLIIRRHILNLMCRFYTEWNLPEQTFPELTEVISGLAEMEKDELIILQPNSLKVTDKGKAFVRNVCMAFDLRLKRKQPETSLFSLTV